MPCAVSDAGDSALRSGQMKKDFLLLQTVLDHALLHLDQRMMFNLLVEPLSPPSSSLV